MLCYVIFNNLNSFCILGNLENVKRSRLQVITTHHEDNRGIADVSIEICRDSNIGATTLSSAGSLDSFEDVDVSAINIVYDTGCEADSDSETDSDGTDNIQIRLTEEELETMHYATLLLQVRAGFLLYLKIASLIFIDILYLYYDHFYVLLLGHCEVSKFFMLY
jgi:hypothetical protein